jgi:hypothetical protein
VGAVDNGWSEAGSGDVGRVVGGVLAGLVNASSRPTEHAIMNSLLE